MALCFEVEINGERSIVAGRPALDVLTAIATYVRSRNELEVRAGGLQRHPDGSSEHFEWIVRTLAVGDEIRIRVVDVESAAEPISITREDSAAKAQSERAYYERLKRKYESGQPIPPADESAL